MQDLEKFKNEMNLSGKNVYVGHRYVPKIMGDWDNTNIYEPLSIVQYQGASYTSRQYVPVGVEITNEEYWVVTGNYNAQVEQYRQDVRNLESDVNNVNDEVIDARQSVDGTVFTTLNNRIEHDHSKLKGLVDQRGINVRDYEEYVTEDGDWTPAFHKALEVNEGNISLIVPAGEYKTNLNLDMYNFDRRKIIGIGNPIFKPFDPMKPCINVGDGKLMVGNFGIQGIELRGTFDAAHTGDGLVLNGCVWGYLDDVRILQFGRDNLVIKTQNVTSWYMNYTNIDSLYALRNSVAGYKEAVTGENAGNPATPEDIANGHVPTNVYLNTQNFMNCNFSGWNTDGARCFYLNKFACRVGNTQFQIDRNEGGVLVENGGAMECVGGVTMDTSNGNFTTVKGGVGSNGYWESDPIGFWGDATVWGHIIDKDGNKVQLTRGNNTYSENMMSKYIYLFDETTDPDNFLVNPYNIGNGKFRIYRSKSFGESVVVQLGGEERFILTNSGVIKYTKDGSTYTDLDVPNFTKKTNMALTSNDTRGNNKLPNWYVENHPKSTIKELKAAVDIGIDSPETNVTLLTYVKWDHEVGMYTDQIAISGEKIWNRNGIGTTWNDWKRLLNSDDYTKLENAIIALGGTV